MKIKLPEQEFDVPNGKKCYSFSQDDGGWQKVNCKYLHRHRDYLSDRDAQSCGFGVTGGYSESYYCSVFRVGLLSEIGYGVKKCDKCLRQNGN